MLSSVLLLLCLCLLPPKPPAPPAPREKDLRHPGLDILVGDAILLDDLVAKEREQGGEGTRTQPPWVREAVPLNAAASTKGLALGPSSLFAVFGRQQDPRDALPLVA